MEACAVQEYTFIHHGYSLRYGDFGQLRATSESVAVDGGEGVGKIYAFQRVTVGESIVSNRSDGCCDVDGIQSVAVVEAIRLNRGKLVAEGDVLDRQLIKGIHGQGLHYGTDVDVL